MQDIITFLENHWMLSSALIVILVLLIFIELLKQTRSGKRLSPAQLTDFINHQNAIVVDLRNVDAYNSGHIVESISLPYKELETKYKKIEKHKSQPIVLICGTGTEAPRAVPLLVQKGFNVYSLAGGIRTWRDAGLPLVKG